MKNINELSKLTNQNKDQEMVNKEKAEIKSNLDLFFKRYNLKEVRPNHYVLVGDEWIEVILNNMMYCEVYFNGKEIGYFSWLEIIDAFPVLLKEFKRGYYYEEETDA